jgi:hypothetical protein
MGDIIKPGFPHAKPRRVTGEDTGPVKRLDNIRVPADLMDGDALAKLGFGRGIPHSEGSTRVGFATLKELRRRALAAEHHANLVHIEYQKLVRHLSDLIGDDETTDPKGAA